MFKTRVRTVRLLIITILVTVTFAGIGIFQAHTYFSGETVTAHVDRCQTHRVYSRHGSHNETTCHGTWKAADGTQHDGDIPGADSYSDEGKDVQLRALGDDVVENSSLGALWPLGVAALGVALSIVAVRTGRRRSGGGVFAGALGRFRRPPTRYGSPPPFGQPAPYPPPGAPQYGQPGAPHQPGAPQYGQQGAPYSGAPQYGQPGAPQPAPPQYGQPPPAPPQYGAPAEPGRPGPVPGQYGTGAPPADPTASPPGGYPPSSPGYPTR